MYNGVKSEVLSTTKFDENSDLSTTYLGTINMTRLDKIKATEKFPISQQWYKEGGLIDDLECQILSDVGTSKSFMSKWHYLRCKSLHSFPKFATKTQIIQVGNGQYISVLFIIPIVIDINGHSSKAQNTVMLKLKFVWNLATMDVSNGSLETEIFYPKEMLDILDLRSIGYYKIKQGILQQNLSKYNRCKSADILCEQFDKFINML